MNINKLGEHFGSRYNNLELVSSGYVDLSSMSLREIPPWLKDLPKIHHLDLSDNLLTDESLKSLKPLYSLNALNVSGNKALTDIPNLNVLHLIASNCSMFGEDLPENLSPWTVDLSYNGITAVPRAPGAVHSVDLTGNKIDFADLGNLEYCAKAVLMSCSINSLGAPSYYLKSLDIRGNEGLIELPRMDSLNILKITGSGVTYREAVKKAPYAHIIWE